MGIQTAPGSLRRAFLASPVKVPLPAAAVLLAVPEMGCSGPVCGYELRQYRGLAHPLAEETRLPVLEPRVVPGRRRGHVEGIPHRETAVFGEQVIFSLLRRERIRFCLAVQGVATYGQKPTLLAPYRGHFH